MKKELQDVIKMGFRVKVGPKLPAWALRKAIQSTKEFDDLVKAVESEKIERKEVEDFINFVWSDIEKEVSCPYNYGLAALAIALERVSDEKYAQEYIENLANHEAMEVGTATRVAEISFEKIKD